MVTILTKSGGFLGPIASLLGLIMNAIYEFFSLFGIHNIALSIFIFTFIARALMLPLTIKQQKFSKMSSRMNPELQKIQAKYKGKKDEASLKKQQAETQALYQKYGSNPTAGCLPVLISLPLMLALYQVINRIPAYVGRVKDMYVTVADKISQTSGYQETLTTFAKEINSKSTDFSTTDKIINLLDKLGTDQWNTLSQSFPQLTKLIADTSANIVDVNSFFGLNIANKPGFASVAILIPIIAAILSFVQGKQLQYNNKDANKDNPAAAAMNSMNVVMPIMQFFFCITFPIGIGIYWIATSIFTIVQQYFVNSYLNSVDLDELIAKNVAKSSKKKPKAIETSSGMSLQELARKQTKSIESNIPAKEKNIEKDEIIENSNAIIENVEANNEDNNNSTGKKSISEIANLLKNKN